MQSVVWRRARDPLGVANIVLLEVDAGLATMVRGHFQAMGILVRRQRPDHSLGRFALQAHRTRLNVYVISLARDLDETVLRFVGLVRDSRTVNLRFSPIILVVQEARRSVVWQAINAGFDDIILLPRDRPSFIGRLTRVAVREVAFFETSTYWGPDRRRGLLQPNHQHERRIDDGEQRWSRRFTVQRTLSNGCEIKALHDVSGDLVRPVDLATFDFSTFFGAEI